MPSERKWFSKSDIWMIVVFIFLAVLIYAAYHFFFGAQDNEYAEIHVDGRVVMRVALQLDTVFSVPSYENVQFTVAHGSIAFTRSNCPDKICIQSGYLQHAGQMAACLPNRMSLRIVSHTAMDTPDAVAR
jgi:hypothetical protein